MAEGRYYKYWKIANEFGDIVTCTVKQQNFQYWAYSQNLTKQQILYTVSQKTSHFWLAIILTYTVRLW